jgi:hypothetical protein
VWKVWKVTRVGWIIDAHQGLTATTRDRIHHEVAAVGMTVEARNLDRAAARLRTLATLIGAGIVFAVPTKAVASRITSTSTSVGAAVGLALLALVATAGTSGMVGDDLRSALIHGLSRAMLYIAAGIATTAVVALTLRSDAGEFSARSPTPWR